MQHIIRYLILFFSLNCLGTNLLSQNLVPNASFEDNNGYPSGMGEWNLMKEWGNLNTKQGWPNGSPDYYHILGSGYGKIPVNGNMGEVYPYQGNAIMGLLAWSRLTKDFREYVDVKLKQPLDSGRTYRFTFRLSNGLKTNGQHGGYGIDSLGVGLSINQLFQNQAEVIKPEKVHYISDEIFSPDWTTITIDFEADKAYEFLTLGNFRNDDETNVFGHSPYGNEAYYFIDDVQLELVEEEYLITGKDSICLGEDVELIAHGLREVYWVDSLNPTKVLARGDTLRLVPERSGIYIAIGLYNRTSHRVRVNRKPSINLGPDTLICENKGLQIQLPAGDYRFTWNDGDMSRLKYVEEPGIYSVEAENHCGTDTDSIELDMIKCTCQLYVPNSFTPNGDLKNDEFSIQPGCHVFNFELMIFNRWGEVVFQTEDARKSWNGYFGYTPAPQGSYIYTIRYNLSEGPVNTLRGVVHLLR